MSANLIPILWESTLQTLYMVAMATVLGTLIGAPLGIFLATSRRGELLSAPILNTVLDLIVNAARSTPFIILVVAIIPLTRLIAGTSIGTTAAIVPLTIAAIVVWQVADTAKSVFAVEAYENFVTVQAESALRRVASSHPYDFAEPGEESLRGSTDLVSRELAEEVAARIKIAGLEVVETRISSLAYAPEIAHAMLQRQQASAVLAARGKIVEGAVGMVEQALARLEEDEVVTLDDERKAAMVSNLLVVLCSDSRSTPVINTGTLYG